MEESLILVPPLFLFSHFWIAEMKSNGFYLSTTLTSPKFLLVPAYLGIVTSLFLYSFGYYWHFLYKIKK